MEDKTKNGRCLLCGMPRGKKRDYICHRCIDETRKGPLYVCGYCGSHGPLTEEVVKVIKSAFRFGQPGEVNQPGVIVQTNVCARCSAKREGTKPEFTLITVNRD